MKSWYAEGEFELEWTPGRRDLLAWILRSEHPGWYAVALMRLQSSAVSRMDLPKYLYDTERYWLIEAMLAANGNITRAAQLLGFKRTTLRARLKAMGLLDYIGRMHPHVRGGLAC